MQLWAYLTIGFLLGIVFSTFGENVYESYCKKIQKQPCFRLKGFHFHHSIYGLAPIGINLFTETFHPFWVGIGIGIILRHTFNERKFTFIGLD